MRPTHLAISFALGASLITFNWTMATEPQRMPNVLWIMLDDGRADALSCYGKAWAKTPHMDAIAAAGVRFETAIVQNPVCTPSRTCIKTGLYAHQTGVMAMGKPTSVQGNYQNRIRPSSDQYNLLQAWSRHGITPMNIGKMHVFQEGWNQLASFQPLLNHNGKPTSLFKETWQGTILSQVKTKTHDWLIGGVVDVPVTEFRQSRIGDFAVDKLKHLTVKDEPFFLRVSFHAPHVACYISPSHLIAPETIDLPFPTPEELDQKPQFEQQNLHVYSGAPDLDRDQIQLARATYYGMVSLVDDQVGRLMTVLRESGKLQNTIVVINSDQGFQLGEHGLWKKRDFYDTNVCIPWIIQAPARLPAGKVVEEPVESIDFLPTLMDLCGMVPPDNIPGRSLLPLLEGKDDSWPEACFSEHDHSQDMYDELRDGGGRRVMVRTKEWKLVFFMDERLPHQDPALYHLRHDPYEQHNLAVHSKYGSKVQELKQLATIWDQSTN